MKTFFIEARAKVDYLPVTKLLLKKLAKYESIGVVATVQYLDGIKVIQNYFNLHNKKVVVGNQGPHCMHDGQVLGCDVTSARSIETKADAIVFIGTGKFHPLAIAAEVDKPIFVANPYLNHIEQISDVEIRKFNNKKAIRCAKVLAAKKIGILATTKLGQNNLEIAIQLKKQLEKQGKQVFVFLGDTIIPSETRNFSTIEVWINTCCPRLVEDDFGKPVANYSELTI